MVDTAAVNLELKEASDEPLTANAAFGAPGAMDEFVTVQGKDPTAEALRRCERWVLKPYRVGLKALGWKSFHKDGDRGFLLFLRVLLVMFWVVLLLFSFITQILSCFRRDQVPLESFNTTIKCKENIISTFLITDALLLASYLFGLYLFSAGSTAEYLSNLAEQVFVKVSQATNGRPPNTLVITILCYFVAGVFWILCSLAVRIIHIAANDLWTSRTDILWGSTLITNQLKQFLVAFSLLGFIIFDLVYVVAVMNYAAQSEMCIHLLWAIKEMVKSKKADLDALIKEIEGSRQYILMLNGKTATATALILFNLGSLGIVALISLDVTTDQAQRSDDDYRTNSDLVLSTIAAGLNACFWIGLVSFPFVQASRVTSAAMQLKDTGPEIRARPFQYSTTAQIDLDSFIVVTQAIRLRATMFGVPIYPWLAYCVVVISSFTMLVLAQQDVYSFTPYL